MPLLPVGTDTSTLIMIGLTLLHKEEGWIAEIYNVEAAFLHPDMTVAMFIEWPEGIVYLCIFTK